MYSHGIPSWSVEQARAWLAEHDLEDVNLVDVRSPAEFEEGHIPGALLLPVSELQWRLGEIDGDKPTLVYCRSGARGAAATSVLLANGFEDVYNITGGIMAWRGQVVDGLPDEGLAWFRSANTLAELIVEAWGMEDGALRFYTAAAAQVDDLCSPLFSELAEAEDHHKAALVNLYRRLVGEPAADQFRDDVEPERMEGGVRLKAVLDWMPGRDSFAVLELALALETTAYDRYVQLERLVKDEDTKRIFRTLAAGEKTHLDQISVMLERRCRAA